MSNKYIGTELEIFAHATNWKNYYASIIHPYLSGKVLEVGAGMGMTTKVLCQANCKKWICLEPDSLLLAKIKQLIEVNELPSFCEAKVGTLSELHETSLDTIIYIDVLEHIENDYNELKNSLQSLKNGGKLVVLSPAHQWLYSPFDQKIGHHRRYTKKSLSSIVPKGFRCIKLSYIDSVGMLASIANKILLKSADPSLKQILFWDRVLVPLSKMIDPLLFFSTGKSVIGIWEKI
ncbi:class I SAM-dependent methyltransferase [Chlorogloeopsis sp. ULAP01]|uniref:class I SAM-dependent methyltransferase n=1 Tax=Chlorogloeopsis sp. ULAP01 TaxID=3056483 RepID=UPI0025AACD33|nr:class I SAM-dependent methyltransferase [Chlorogloeopsis sp. ULAP01]MDM9383277.1 class I SAM-dependent methyltransferase [Chlorogloeopsis sp. ULAP01]